MMDFKTIETGRLRIEKFEERHLAETYVAWLNDPEVVRFSEQRHRTHSLESCRAYFESFSGRDDLFLAIVTGEGVHIGNITVVVDRNNNTADVAIMIGDRNYWGRGLGQEAFRIVVDTLLQDHGIRKVTAGTMEANAAMLKAFEHAGMEVEARRRGQYLLNGREVDGVHAAKWNQP
jgi:RimJ/RimL family protein N-acetyltransferase